MDMIQTFYDQLASQYHKLFFDWQTATREQAVLLDSLFARFGFTRSSRVLDCACGIGTQAIGLASLGYRVTGSDLSEAALAEANKRAQQHQVQIPFLQGDFRALEAAFDQRFDIVMAMDNALPHMLTHEDLSDAVRSMVSRVDNGGLFVASIRDYDALLTEKPSYSPPYIHKTANGQRVSFQTWDWEDDRYKLTQYIIEDEGAVQVSKFHCAYRATTRQELTDLLLRNGCKAVTWLFPEETGFYQPIVVGQK